MYNSGFLVIEIAPANNETNVPINKSITVKFAFDMIEDTVTTSTLLLSKVNGSAVPVSVTYDRKSRTAFVKPSADLEKGTQYRLTIIGGDNGISSITGTILTENKLYEFSTTDDVAVSTPNSVSVIVANGFPTISWVQPDQYDADKAVEYKVYVSSSSINPDDMPASVVWPASVDALGKIEGTTITVPKQLADGTYYAYVYAINGTAKSPWANSQFLIETATPVPPSNGGSGSGVMFEVHATYPQSDAVHITPDSIKILFTDDVDMTTVTTSTVYIIKAPKPKSLTIIDFMTKFAPNQAMPYTIDSPTMNNMVSLTVDPTIIENNTEYTVVVRETVKSVSGEPLGEAHVWSFVSTYAPLFGDAERIRDDIKVFLRNVPDKILYRYMYDTSLGALDIASRTISPFDEEDFLAAPPRYMGEYVRYQTGYDLVVNAITQELNGVGATRTLGDLTIQPNQNIGQITPLLESFKARLKRWEDELHGHHNRGYAKPTTAVKGETGAAYPTHLTRTELTDPSEG